MNRRRRVVVTQRFFDDEAISYLTNNDCQVVIADLSPGEADDKLSHEHLAGLLAEADGWIVGHAWVTRALLNELPRLKVVSRRGVGYDRIDLAAATEFGRVVAVAIGGNDIAVADQAVGMMLAVGRRLGETREQMKKGFWSILIGTDLSGKTVGVVGLGRIGRAVVQRLKGFETRTLIATPHPDEAFAAANRAVCVDIQTLLRESDYVSLHAPLTSETRSLIGAAAISTMKPTAIVINTARGGLVEDAHLLAALKEGRLGGAGLDVFMSETDPAYRAVTEELITLPNVVATPHSAGSTRGSLSLTNMIAAQSVVAVLNGGSPPSQRIVADGRRQ